jgi:membrane-bound metal-dependent hydrolase YbcI (DUF457 family)
VDLFTHVLVAYLLSFALVGGQPAYLAAGALAGGIPDGDILLWPLARRWPIFRHHGISHSVLGVTVVAAVGGLLVAPRLVPGNPLLFFVVMEVAGLAHMLQDGFTHFSVPPLLPFSEKKLELDADRAINLLTLVVSVFGFWLLLAVERGRAPYWVYLDTVYALMAVFALYFGVRLLGRLFIGRVVRRYPEYRVPVPTANPFVWMLLFETRANGRLRTGFVRYVLGRGVVRGPMALEVGLEAATDAVDPERVLAPVTTREAAIERSYPIARRESAMFDETYHFADVDGDPRRGWLVTWYSLEYTAFGRAAAVAVRLESDGTASAKRAWHTPLWRRELT